MKPYFNDLVVSPSKIWTICKIREGVMGRPKRDARPGRLGSLLGIW